MVSRTRPQTGLRPKACARNLTRPWTEPVCAARSSGGASAESNLLSGTPDRSVANARSGRTSDKGYSPQRDCVALGVCNTTPPNRLPNPGLAKGTDAFRPCGYTGGHMARTSEFMKPSSLRACVEAATLTSYRPLRSAVVTALAGL
jgi:hypothetical protein